MSSFLSKFTPIFILSLLFLGLFLLWPIKEVPAQVPSIVLEWTSPGDDSTSGIASTYQMRYSTSAPDTTSQATTTTWWNTATPVNNLPAPLVAGTKQQVTVTPAGGFAAGSTVFFIMKACDEVPNCSLYSNVARKIVPDSTPPARIVDLIVK